MTRFCSKLCESIIYHCMTSQVQKVFQNICTFVGQDHPQRCRINFVQNCGTLLHAWHFVLYLSKTLKSLVLGITQFEFWHSFVSLTNRLRTKRPLGDQLNIWGCQIIRWTRSNQNKSEKFNFLNRILHTPPAKKTFAWRCLMPIFLVHLLGADLWIYFNHLRKQNDRSNVTFWNAKLCTFGTL